MKKLTTIIAVLFFCGTAFGQLKDVHKIFDKYQEAEGITSIKIGKPMFNMLNKLYIQDEDLQKIKPLLGKVNSINILVSGGGKLLDSLVDLKPFSVKQGQNPPGLQNEINQAVKKLNLMELVTINSSGRKIKLLTENSSGDVLHTLLLSITGSDQNVLMLLDGDIPMAELSKFISDQK
ncbi:DUF4252 domain-containing protein [Paradesertivirga mongoliensis]|uniref:DUF4252 domain-containing protein n=1 Tax=Paradesertivirga mongoliensis TaxID=2100740 RepID=A0ABW4ZRE5_9SPHI|nr:DUF4252 domain-containing protein [Pedobacter mongoliensis]